VRYNRVCWGLLVLAAGLGVPAAGQESTVQDISIEIGTHYLTAYRDSSWVPVDVVVRNTRRDVTGYLAVRLSSGGRAQAPVYRIPVDSPRGSTKRFRVYCFFEATDKVSAMLYDRGRSALPRPFEVQLPPPILEEDFLHLVLDLSPDEGYAFLHRAVEAHGEQVRAVRESLRPHELDALPDYPQCYESYDALLIGNLDPTRISVAHRELILRFVQRGGTLVIVTGANAPKLRGTWLEEAAGAAFTTDISIKETELAASVFGPEAAAQARPDWECVFTELRPQTPETQVFGAKRILATRRPLGQGQIITLAIDVDSKALQRTPEYIRFWSTLCTRKQLMAEPFFREAAWAFTAMIPRTAGIRVHPRSSVVAYLLVYFGVAIVANWIVWSILKRREMAWLCLVFFSIGFTLYAMIVGTAGRAKANELREVQVLQVPLGGGASRLQTVTGVLTARTLRFSMAVQQENMLVCDLRSIQSGAMYGYGMPAQTGSAGRRPFEFTPGAPGAIDDFVVGASETRSFEGEAYIQLPGGFEGELLLDDTGLHGTVKNETGITLLSPSLLFEGALLPLEQHANGEFSIHLTPEQLSRKTSSVDMSGFVPNAPGSPVAVDPFTGRPATFIAPLLTGTAPDYGGGSGAISWLLGPCICGWADGAIPPSVVSERPFQKQSVQRFVMADVPVLRAETVESRWLPLNAGAPYQQGIMTEPQQVDVSGKGTAVPVYLPRSLSVAAVEELQVEFYADDTGGNTRCVLEPVEDSPLTVRELSSERTEFMGRRMAKTVYAVDGFREEIARNARAAGGVPVDARFGYPLYLSAHLVAGALPDNLSEEERREREIQIQRERALTNNYRQIFLTGRTKVKTYDQRGGGDIAWQ